MGFEVFQKSSAPLAKVPQVTIQQRGLISLNRSAYAAIGNPEAVELLFDADRKIVGLRPTVVSNPNAYPVRPQGSGDSGPLLVAGQMFTKYYRIDTTQAIRYIDPEVVDGVLCIALNGEHQVVTSNRSRGKEAKSAP